MAWIAPKTDWTETDFCTYGDMNRVAGNVNFLLGTSTLKDDYDNDDIVTLTEWQAILSGVNSLITDYGYELSDDDTTPNSDVTALNFNAVESLTLALKEWIDLLTRQQAAKIYAGDGIITSKTPENYVR